MKLTAILALCSSLATGAMGLGLDLFSDGDCQNQIDAITVPDVSCKNHSPGWSSMRVNAADNGVTLTAYTKNNCNAGSSTPWVNPAVGDCLKIKDSGFVANSVGYF
ncbi:hypothetical protein E8E14_001035 [Neopestalotiopsis sp. 37M]|nr:hypothetical protein E8E14_001035 [Neopestalotiopsis sp. 37M]